MYNPITFVKDIIDLLRDSPGPAVRALEITEENRSAIVKSMEPRAEKYANVGDFVVEFQNNYTTIAPRTEFFKHFAFVGEPRIDNLTPIRTIKPL